MPKMNGFELDNKVKVCFISAYDVDYTALRELSIIRKRCTYSRKYYAKTDRSRIIERIELELLT
jgi:hypothetical protein